jgi:hypothetical protein
MSEKKVATYTRMANGTQEDYLLLQEHSKPLGKDSGVSARY